ncbi:MAG: STM4013/SEN3800 family hydrolase [Deltaproteobacteria bacterium]|nr:STM4013/SEN3800 family hydrolase [Deltaproteobacteria bacterium]
MGSHDLLWITLDTLRFDVAQAECLAGRTPNLARLLPGGQWQERHSPATFTYAAHHAFFAGFLPTPARPGPHTRHFAARFAGSESTDEHTMVFDSPDVVSGLRALGYHTVCVGGVGFFNKQNPLGSVLPSLFDESHWSPALGVTEPRSTEHQVSLACDMLRARPPTQRVFLFVNVSAIHQPNRSYLDGHHEDSVYTHAAALRYVDSALQPLFDTLQRRAPTVCMLFGDHGTAYGEDGYHGHRVAHPVVFTVPYGEFVLPLVSR